jgi:phosphatidylglycerophosphatase A
MTPIERIQFKNLWHVLAVGFGSGLSPIMPGTTGTLAAIPFYLLLTQLPFGIYLSVVAIAALAGIQICHRTAHDMGVHDHGAIVWDEFVGFWITMIPLQYMGREGESWQWILVGFVLFRLFDIVKPWPICWLDQHVKGGVGIMSDDIVAGILAGFTLFLLRFSFF